MSFQDWCQRHILLQAHCNQDRWNHDAYSWSPCWRLLSSRCRKESNNTISSACSVRTQLWAKYSSDDILNNCILTILCTFSILSSCKLREHIVSHSIIPMAFIALYCFHSEDHYFCLECAHVDYFWNIQRCVVVNVRIIWCRHHARHMAHPSSPIAFII